ncbi:hypothetical protein CROQUDRAFT_656619 [Cronartium quercuum f. sp. fusiforme G11]|uniref:DNA-directed RNA polymerase subunit n=1 Tax=Cronartium quercuum f. sp. fusiforme G11 TaxID=708437 RepID=A0A9P6TCT1_9BASI|nr:hypothetical protein CROQUDRAFT_656619 [Cronartium quercuum f. sp. fusiforme G11]
MSNRIGSLLFCADCGNLLDVPGEEDQISCDQCGRTESAKSQEGFVIVTRSHPSAFPSSLRQKRALVQPPTSAQDLDPAQAAPLMDETCPKCQNPQMKYHTLQLRSADEGTTVFYECPKCGHKFSTNN